MRKLLTREGGGWGEDILATEISIETVTTEKQEREIIEASNKVDIAV